MHVAGNGDGDDVDSSSDQHDHQSDSCFFRYGKLPCNFASDPKIIALLKAAGGV
jgi:hypothetical protein